MTNRSTKSKENHVINLILLVLSSLVPSLDACERNEETAVAYYQYVVHVQNHPDEFTRTRRIYEATHRYVIWQNLRFARQSTNQSYVRYAVPHANVCVVNEPRVGIWPAPVPVEYLR